MRQKIKAIIDLAPTTNIAEARHLIDLIGYYRKFFPVFSDMIKPLNELSKKNVPFKWTEQCQKSLDYIKQVITTNPILFYPDPNKQYYHFTHSSKHSWSGILVQYTEQAREDGTKLKVFHPITYQSGTLQGPKKLEYFNKRGICYLHVFLQNGILSKRSTCNSQM